MAKFPIFEEMAKNIAEKALDDFLYNGKSIREWMHIIASEDCISRKAVLALAKEECDTAIIPYRKFVKDVNALSPVTPAQTWIPVSERLPEYDEDIIITHKGAMGQPITSVSYYDGDFRTEDGDGYFSDVMVWMPLPEPYKAESEETDAVSN